MPRFAYIIGFVLVAVALMIVGVVSLLPARSECKALPPDKVCEMNLSDISHAIKDYQGIHGSVTATVEYCGNQQSWRTMVAQRMALASGIEKDFLFHFDEPWESAYNQEVVKESVIKFRFACPADRQNVESSDVSYVMLVRSSDPQERHLSTSSSLPKRAVLIVESANSGIALAQPRDILWEDLWIGDSPFGPGKLHSMHRDIVKAIRVDGTVIDIPKTLSKDEVKAILSGE